MKTSRDDGIKQFSIQHPTYFSHYTCIMWKDICKMVLYTELFYAIIPACFAVLLSLHLHTFLMIFTLVILNGGFAKKLSYFLWLFLMHSVQDLTSA